MTTVTADDATHLQEEIQKTETDLQRRRSAVEQYGRKRGELVAEMVTFQKKVDELKGNIDNIKSGRVKVVALNEFRFMNTALKEHIAALEKMKQELGALDKKTQATQARQVPGLERQLVALKAELTRVQEALRKQADNVIPFRR